MKQALLIIDAQQELIDGNEQEKAVWKREELLSNINLVIEKALKAEALIVFVRDRDVAGGEGRGFQVHDGINIPSDVNYFDKLATNSFYGTKLLEFLKEQDVEHLVMMGCKTEQCVDTAVKTATVNGFDVTLVGDGHSTTDTEVLTADKIIAHYNDINHAHYNVDHFSMVRKAEEDLFKPQHDEHR